MNNTSLKNWGVGKQNAGKESDTKKKHLQKHFATNYS